MLSMVERVGIVGDLWDAATGRRLAKPDRGRLEGFRPDGKAVLFALPGNRFQFWDPIVGRLLGQPIDTEGQDRILANRPDGKSVLTLGLGGMARIWDLSKRGPIGEPLRLNCADITVAFSADGLCDR